MYHKDQRKDFSTAFKAFDIVKKIIPQLHVTLFGVYDKPDLPMWYDYYQRPEKTSLTICIIMQQSMLVQAKLKVGD